MKNATLMLKRILCIILFLMPYISAFSQGAAINTAGTTADPSAMLDISSNNSGLLIPRLTEAQKNAISSPATGLMIYQTDATTGFWYFNGSVWTQAIGPAGATGATGAIGATGTTGSAGLLSPGATAGNTPYWDGSQWVVNSSNIYNNGGSIGIGTTTPDASAAIDIYSTDKGALIPRLTTTQRNAIATPAEGLIIYNLTTRCFETYISPMWQSIFCGCNPPSSPTAGTDSHTKTSVTWNWNTASGATGYKYNTVNNYNTATDNGTSTSFAQSGLVCNTAYTLYVWAYNSCGPSTVTTLTETTSVCLSIGDSYAGGIIFYLNGSGGGLVCAASDQSTSIIWGNQTLVGTSTAVGTGQANTTAIVNAGNTQGAAYLCYNLVFNGYSDWFLPSINELQLMYTNLYLAGLGGLGSADYWSSTEYAGNPTMYALYWTMYGATSSEWNKGNSTSKRVRAVRAF